MRLDIFTLFPEAFDWFRAQRHVQNAERDGLEMRLLNYRETTPLRAGQVDDAPYGGGAGMVLRVDVVDAALQHAYGDQLAGHRVVLLTPTGRTFDEELARELASERELALLCGRYEGVDDRVRQHLATDAISIGRFVISGGELAAMVVADALVRKLPGALGAAESAVEESFSEALGGAPEYPHYTRPPTYRGWGVPEVLLSGDHERVQRWRLDRSRERAGG
ncbi:MAG TPA: tRNA (guanosine(37)-N1)-methyltransferase TrmD [Solirubrobacterales bacterium]|jgi:tRNA (guanine37-N1)-methyltransferase|nr:tRNA (guanosine(37)-N1)-methyltransferase TrmD [Solirubrobacterales bacterium]